MSAINIKVPKGLKERIDEIARQDRRTLAATVQIALEMLVEQREKAAAKKR